MPRREVGKGKAAAEVLVALAMHNLGICKGEKRHEDHLDQGALVLS